jgi:hypothetical protein
MTAYRGEHLRLWKNRANLLNRWRLIADRYHDLNVSIYDDDAPFLDQIDTLLPITIQDSIITLACMAVVCALFMWNLFHVIIATLTIISICIGMIGDILCVQEVTVSTEYIYIYIFRCIWST